jgi:hypothetical protein
MMMVIPTYQFLTLQETTPSQQTTVTMANLMAKEEIAFADRASSENMAMDWVKALEKALEQAMEEGNDLERASVTRENLQVMGAFSHYLVEQVLAQVLERGDCSVCIAKLLLSYSYLSSCRCASWTDPRV